MASQEGCVMQLETAVEAKQSLPDRVPPQASLALEVVQAFPDFLIISPPKTGSTWLATNLRCHPEVFVPDVKEVKYFSSLFRHLGLDWYLEHFRAAAGRVKGEATPAYSILPVRTIRRIRALAPHLKVIFLMRDPVGRAWSHAKHNYNFREANFQAFAGALEDVSEDRWLENFIHEWPLTSGDYLGQLRRWLSVFPREQVFVGFYESIANSPQALLRSIFDFLGVSANVDFSAFPACERILEGPRMELPPVLKGQLRLLLQERTRELAAFLDPHLGLRPPDEWNRTLEPKADGHSGWPQIGDFSRPAFEVFRREFDDDYLARVLEIEVQSLSPRLVRSGYHGFNIVFYRDRFYALAEALGPVDVEGMSDADRLGALKREGWMIASSLEEAMNAVKLHKDVLELRQRLAEVSDSLKQPPLPWLEPQLLEVYRGFNLVGYQSAVLGLSEALGPVDAREVATRAQRHGAEHGPQDIVTGSSVEAAKLRLDVLELSRRLDEVAGRLEPPSPPWPEPQLLELYRGFNLVGFQGAVLGLSEALGPVDACEGAAALAQRYGVESVLWGGSADVVKARIDAAEAARAVRALEARTKPPLVPWLEPQLLEVYRGFNVVDHAGTFFGVRQEAGSVDVSRGETALAAEHGPDNLVAGDSVAVVKARIDATELTRALAALHKRVDAHLTPWAQPKHLGNYRGFNLVGYAGTVFGLHQHLGPLDPARGAEALIAEYGPEAVVAGDSADAVRAFIDIRELGKDLVALTHRLSRLEAPPKEEEPYGPVLLESYRSFNIVRCGLTVFGLRESLGPVDPTWGAEFLVGLYGPKDVVVAGSSDGVRARIDALYTAAEAQALADEVKQLKAVVDQLRFHAASQKAQTRGDNGSSLDASPQECAGTQPDPEARTLPPLLVRGGYNGYNVVAYRGQFYALSEALGPVNLEQMSDAERRDARNREGWIVADLLAEAEERVNREALMELWERVRNLEQGATR
jgi:hypothetical protein